MTQSNKDNFIGLAIIIGTIMGIVLAWWNPLNIPTGEDKEKAFIEAINSTEHTETVTHKIIGIANITHNSLTLNSEKQNKELQTLTYAYNPKDMPVVVVVEKPDEAKIVRTQCVVPTPETKVSYKGKTMTTKNAYEEIYGGSNKSHRSVFRRGVLTQDDLYQILKNKWCELKDANGKPIKYPYENGVQISSDNTKIYLTRDMINAMELLK